MRINAAGRELINLFKEDYNTVESIASAEKAVSILVKKKINQNQFSALVSFVVDRGIDELKHSALLKLINSGEILKAADMFLLPAYCCDIDDDNVRYYDEFRDHHRKMEKELFLKLEVIPKRKRGK